MVDLSELNYKQLIALEKEIQKEKAKKVRDHLTKSDLINSEKSRNIESIIDPRFQNAKYGYPNDEWKEIALDSEYMNSLSEAGKKDSQVFHERPEVTRRILGRLEDARLYMCDIAFENYRDYKPKYMTGPNRDKPKIKDMMVAMNKEIPWQFAEQYKSMYNELCDIFIKYAKGELNDKQS